MRRLFFVAVGMLFLFAALLPTRSSFVAGAVSDGERLAMFSKPSVVRIIGGVAGTFYFAPPKQQPKNYTVSYIGLGSGFFINSSGYIVTNAHVVSTSHDIKQKGQEAGHELLFYQLLQQVARAYNVNPNALTRENVVFIRNYSRLTEMKQYHHVIIPDGSVYEFEEKQYGAPVGQGKDVAVIKIEVKNAPVLLLGNSDAMKLQDHVTVLGYPGAADTFNSGILDSKSTLEASITDGKISAQKKSASGAPVLQVSAPATHGNSGGPVMPDKMEVAGLRTFGGDRVNDQEISGLLSWCHPVPCWSLLRQPEWQMAKGWNCTGPRITREPFQNLKRSNASSQNIRKSMAWPRTASKRSPKERISLECQLVG